MERWSRNVGCGKSCRIKWWSGSRLKYNSTVVRVGWEWERVESETLGPGYCRASCILGFLYLCHPTTGCWRRGRGRENEAPNSQTENRDPHYRSNSGIDERRKGKKDGTKGSTLVGIVYHAPVASVYINMLSRIQPSSSLEQKRQLSLSCLLFSFSAD